MADGKAIFQQQREKIDSGSYYARAWLPAGYESKNIFTINTQDRRRVFEESLLTRRFEILRILDSYDNAAAEALAHYGVDEARASEVFTAATGETLGSRTYEKQIKLNKVLEDGSGLFGSRYFSAILDITRAIDRTQPLHKLVAATLQLYVGSLSQQHVKSLNEALFSAVPDDLAVFDEMQNLFSVDIGQAGVAAFEAVMEADPKGEIGREPSTFFESIVTRILERVVAAALDYQAFVDANFGYLYRPSEWSKFTKFSIFLHAVRNLVAEQERNAIPDLPNSHGYYHDIVDGIRSNKLSIGVVGTANYTRIFQEIVGRDISAGPILHLNGSLRELYDPYRNEIVVESEASKVADRFLVPFLFTQSGIKPMTSVDMSRRYVDFYDGVKESDALVVLGFGFNGDDGHINGLIRKACEDEKTRVVICHYEADIDVFDVDAQRVSYINRLRLRNDARLDVVPIADNRTSTGGRAWLDEVLDRSRS